MSDELALREAMHELTAGQPPAPADRYAGVRRRFVRRRLVTTTAAAGAAAVAVAGAVLIGNVVGNSGTAQPLNRGVPTWAMKYDDTRDGSVPQSVLDGAVTAWRWAALANSTGGEAPAPARVVWYVGNLVADGSAVAVMFEVDTGSRHLLVAGWATAENVMHGQSAHTSGKDGGSSPWVLWQTPAPAASTRTIFGLNVHGPSSPPGQENPDNWVVVLAPPSAVIAHVAFAGTFHLNHGFGYADAHQVQTDGPLEVSAKLSNGLWIGGHVGIPGVPESAVPQLAAAPPFTGRLPRGTSLDVGFATQGPTLLGVSKVTGSGTVVIDLVCQGFGVIRIRPGLEHGRFVQSTCDSDQHRLRVRVHGGVDGFSVRTSDYNSWRIRSVLVR